MLEVCQRVIGTEVLAEANGLWEETMAENVGLHAQLLSQAREAEVLGERQRDGQGDSRHAGAGPHRHHQPAGGGAAVHRSPGRLEPGQRGPAVHQRGDGQDRLLHIHAKLGVSDRAAGVGIAFERGLLPRSVD
jgi:hypothetical protein